MAQHLALYRKWRPLIFDDVFGQDHVTRALKTQVESGRTSHAYLFTGTRGTGKTTCAKILARAVCCERPVGGNPCNECPSCRAILEDSALDVSEIDAASNNGVDNIREIREEAAFSPAALKKRVYIIDEVHMLSAGAFNALLKTLEEPPEHVLFILATTEIHKVPATILSRCQRYDFRRIPAEIIAARLSQIAGEEGVQLEPGAASLLARLGDGSMRDAISLLDRSLSAQGRVDVKQVTDALGVPSSETVIELYRAAAEGDGPRALEIFTDCYLEGRDIVSLFDQLLSLLRDLYLLKVTGREEYLLSSADPAELRPLAQQAEGALLDYFVSCVSDLLTRLTRTAIKRTDGEMCLLKMCLRHQSRGVDGGPLSQNAGEPSAPREKKSPDPWTAAPAAPPAERKKPARTAAPAPSGDDRAAKSAFMAVAGPQVSAAVRTYLNMAEMQVADRVLHIACRKESMIFMNKPAVQTVLRSAAQACGHRDVVLREQEAPAPGPQGGDESSLPEQGAEGGAALEQILANARRLGVDIKPKEE